MPSMSPYDRAPKVAPELLQGTSDRVISIRRISKVTAGGKNMRFNALVALGDGQGRIGIGLGKATAVPDAVRKGVATARRNVIEIPLSGTTIPHFSQNKFRASQVLLKPASPGTGVVAGATVRAIMELTGIRDVLTKAMGSRNPINLAKATVDALASMTQRENLASAPSAPSATDGAVLDPTQRSNEN